MTQPVETLKAPFPYFGGKSRVAAKVWRRFGDVANYIEPFCGSLAVLLAAPTPPPIATLNDADGLLVNFWRAVRAEPEAVAAHLDWPVTEIDLFARHVWLVQRREGLTERLMADPEYYDVQAAGWWCWGACAWIGAGWCSGRGAWTVEGGRVVRRNAGQGVNRQLPHLGNAGQGVNRVLPHLGNAGQGVNRVLPQTGQGKAALEAVRQHLEGYMWALAARLRTARITCGDFERVLGYSVTTKLGLTGVFLDPPYDSEDHDRSMYADYDHSASARARQWAAQNGDNPLLRIALCGYDDEHDELLALGWTKERWLARRGYQAVDEDGFHSGHREAIWFSPHCLKSLKQPLWEEVAP